MMPELLDASAVMRVLAHRYPILLVDRIQIIEPGKRVEGLKRVTGAESLGYSCRESRPSLPDMLVVEALAQTSAALLLGLVGSTEGAVGYFAAIERVRLRGPAVAGDTLLLAVQLKSFRRGVAHLDGLASVAGRRVVSARFTTIVRGASQVR